MKKILTFTATGVLLILISGGATFIMLSEHYTGHLPWQSPNTKGVIYTNLHSGILDENREIIIRLPVHYDSTKAYPVMYVLDGSSDDKHIADKFEVLSAVGYVPETIVVGIPNMTARNRQLNLTPPFMYMDPEDSTSSLGEADKFLAFFEKELIPFIEANYPTSGERLITGNSRGGLLVMYSLVTKPSLFTARFCYSTPFWRQHDILVSKVADFLHAHDTLPTFMYMSAGASETDNIKNGLARLTTVFQNSAPTGLTWYSNYTVKAVHQDNARVSASIGIEKWGEYLKANGRYFENNIVTPVGKKYDE